MKNIKIGVVEDETLLSLNICDTLVKFGYEVCDPVTNYTDALEMVDNEQPDLLLLDIQLSGSRDGIELAHKIRKDNDMPIIFLTANSDPDTVERAKQASPNAFLVKPFNKNELFASIEVAVFNFNFHHSTKTNEKPNEELIRRDYIFIKEGALFRKVLYEDVLYLQSDTVYVNIVTKNKNFMIRETLDRYLENFDPWKFRRVHRRYAINLDYITTIEGGRLFLNNTIEIPVSAPHMDELRKILHLE